VLFHRYGSLNSRCFGFAKTSIKSHFVFHGRNRKPSPDVATIDQTDIRGLVTGKTIHPPGASSVYKRGSSRIVAREDSPSDQDRIIGFRFQRWPPPGEKSLTIPVVQWPRQNPPVLELQPQPQSLIFCYSDPPVCETSDSAADRHVPQSSPRLPAVAAAVS
jgi:hypothetical protein